MASSFALAVLPGWAADYPPPKEGDWIVRDFRFHTGEILPELRIHFQAKFWQSELAALLQTVPHGGQ